MVCEMEQAGKVYKVIADGMMERAASGLYQAGIQKFEYDEKRKQIRFSVNLFGEEEDQVQCEYVMTVYPSTSQITIEYHFPKWGKPILGNTLLWYIQMRNMQINSQTGVKQGSKIHYTQTLSENGRIRMGIQGQINIKNEPEKWVCRLLVRMNMQLQKDHKVIKSMMDGTLPENIRKEIVNEYQGYT
ncbi:MAG: hypothetical protein EOM40_15245 [Clostridia bacterium]|nr:hypothetical protein [Clostridia bacterium]